MTPERQAAEFLLNLRETQMTVETLPEGFRPNSPTDAHAVQSILVDALMQQGAGELAGYKVATTSKTAQEMLNVSGPFSGHMLSKLVHDSGVALKRSDYTDPIAEPEFAFRMTADVPLTDTPYTPESIAPFLGDLMPAIEIVDHRYNSLGTAGGNCILADNAIFGCVVLGEPVSDWRDADLATQPVVFSINDEPFADGTGANALGHPLNVMAWLANDLASRGKRLLAGQVVITGTVTGVYRANAGDLIVGDFGRFGTVSLNFV